MKKINNNTYPLVKVSNSEFIEGYWFPSSPSDKDYDIGYPVPIKTNIPIDEIFLNKLCLMSNKHAMKLHYNGYSKCRICGCNNGNVEFVLEKDGIKFRYPEGLMHYYEIHNVQPSKEFFDFIINY